MAAQIPIKSDPAANEAALARVLADKEREASDGHDGTWVAHPGLVPVALQAFDKHMPTANQISKQRDDVNVSAKDLLAVPTGTITEDGLRGNIRVGVQYLEAWQAGNGAYRKGGRQRAVCCRKLHPRHETIQRNVEGKRVRRVLGVASV